MTMQAAYITEHGSPDVIQIGRLPPPSPGPMDVLVQVETAAVNHVDTFVRSGAYATPTPFPFVIGRDLVGTVVESPVAQFAAGDRVWCNSLGHDGRQGSFAQYAAIAPQRLYKLPAGVAAVQAAPVLHTAATAYLGLFRTGSLTRGQTLLVAGAGGGVGSAAVQLATSAGARVIATCAEDDIDWCLSLGAERTFDYRAPNLPALLRDAAPDGYDMWWDNSGRTDLTLALPLLARGGQIIALAGMSARPVLPMGDLYTRDASIRGFVISNASTHDLAAAARVINRHLAAQQLMTRPPHILSLADAAEAHRRMEAGVRGRILLVV